MIEKIFATDEELLELVVRYGKHVSNNAFFLEVEGDAETIDNCFDVDGKKCLSVGKIADDYFFYGKSTCTSITFPQRTIDHLLSGERITCYLTDLPFRIIVIKGIWR